MAPPADRFARHPGQNSPNTHAHLPKPVQNSPNTAKIAHFGPFLARWATCVAPPAAISLTERFIFIATTCLGHGKLALALTRHSCPPCRMAIGML